MAVRPWSEKIWFSPCYVINELTAAVISRDKKKIKRAKEAWICAVALICRSKIEPDEWWIQLPESDPPDVLAMKLIPTDDGEGQQLSQLPVEVFEISEFDKETIEESILRKLENQDYSGMMVVGFVRRLGGFDHQKIAERLQNTTHRAGSVNLIVHEDENPTNISFIQLFPEIAKFKTDFGEFCKKATQKEFVEMSRGTKTKKSDGTTTDWLTLIP